MELSTHMIDWEEQWKIHAPGYKNGLVKIPLESFGGPKREIFLKPGGGFGDLSHPTTRLTLQLLLPLVKGLPFLDIGCGSGILSLAALGAGASEAIGIDICQEALEHAHQNALLNHMHINLKIAGELKKIPSKAILAMNMIRTEQEQAWASLPPEKNFSFIVTSGLLKEEKSKASKLYSSWGLQVVEQQESDGWIAFILKSSS